MSEENNVHNESSEYSDIDNDDGSNTDTSQDEFKNNLSLNKSSEENEVFFGPITKKEKKIINKLGNRKTEILFKFEALENDAGMEITTEENKCTDNKIKESVGENKTVMNKQLEYERVANVNGLDSNVNIQSTDEPSDKDYTYSLKRVSYFTSLETINVHNQELYESLNTTDENKPEENQIRQNQTSCYNSSDSLYPSSTDPESLNHGVLITNTSNDHLSTNDLENPCKNDLNDSPIDKYLSSSLEQKMNIAKDNGLHETPEDHSSSPETKFNDTIEEMELLLKHGLNYFKENCESNESTSNKNNEISKEESNNTPKIERTHSSLGSSNSYPEESIISPKREVTILSTDSVNSFNPNFDSTHTSTDICEDIKKNIVPLKSNVKEDTGLPCISKSNFKKLAPSKPPRIEALSATPGTLPRKLQFHKILDKTQTPKTIPKISRSNSPIPKNSTPNMYHAKFQNSLKANNPLSLSAENLFTSKVNPSMLTHSSKKPILNDKHTQIWKDLKTNLISKSSLSLSAENLYNPKLSDFYTPISKFSSKKLDAASINEQTVLKRAPNSGTPSSQFLSRIPKSASKYNRPFFTPQSKVNQNSKKIIYSNLRNVTSPVTKYLKDNPPPPLITTVKPRYKLRPSKITKEALSFSPIKRAQLCHLETNLKPNLHETLKREEVLQKIHEDVAKLTLKINAKSTLKEFNSSVKEIPETRYTEAEPSALPQSIYHLGTGIHVNNKENMTNNRREIPNDNHPTLVQKHRGRVVLPKSQVRKLMKEYSKEPSHYSGDPESDLKESSREQSMMEVSIYEHHTAKRTHTLH